VNAQPLSVHANMTVVLLVLICNVNSIARRLGDPRYTALRSAGIEMQRRGHTVLVQGAGALSDARVRRERNLSWMLAGFKTFDRRTLHRYGQPKLVVCWFNYLNDGLTRRSALVVKLLRNPQIPHLYYEHGMTAGSTTVDPGGFLSQSFYVSSLNALVQRSFDEPACDKHIANHLKHDSSKRPQRAAVDLPATILGRYLFVPTQKFGDASIKHHSRISFPQLLRNVTLFCRARDLPLVIKLHPMLPLKEATAQRTFIKTELQRRHDKVHLSKGSINFLVRHALFTATLNGGTQMDNFFATSPVLTLAPGFFSSTDAVVHEGVDVMRGLRLMADHELPWSEERKRRQRQVVCWYERHSLKAANSGLANLAVLQAHNDVLRLPSPLKL